MKPRSQAKVNLGYMTRHRRILDECEKKILINRLTDRLTIPFEKAVTQLEKRSKSELIDVQKDGLL